MAFGFFKKKQTADLVFTNAKVYTLDPDLPWADAVACEEGKIICVGANEDVEELIDDDTQVVDLEGKYLLPGFINTHAHPAAKIFADEYLVLSDLWDRDTVLGTVTDYVDSNPFMDSFFAYGFDEAILDDLSREENRALLDRITEDKPILLLSRGEGVLWTNNLALERVTAMAEQDGVQNISLNYCLQALEMLDYEGLQEKMEAIVMNYCEKGFTSVVNAGAPEFMNSIYQDLVMDMNQQEIVKQRNFDSLQIERNMPAEMVMAHLMHKKTQTMEMDDMATCDILKLVVGRETPVGMDEENFKNVLKQASERGFTIMIEALDKTALRQCVEAVSETRDAGYRKNNIIFTCEKEYRAENESFSLDEFSLDNVHFLASANREPGDDYAMIAGKNNIEGIIETMTQDAAIALGLEDRLGTIEHGKDADFVIFEDNPFDAGNGVTFKKRMAAMLVMNGKIVYDEEEDVMSQWYDIMAGMHI